MIPLLLATAGHIFTAVWLFVYRRCCHRLMAENAVLATENKGLKRLVEPSQQEQLGPYRSQGHYIATEILEGMTMSWDQNVTHLRAALRDCRVELQATKDKLQAAQRRYGFLDGPQRPARPEPTRVPGPGVEREG